MALPAEPSAADASVLDAGGTPLPPELAHAQARREKLRAAKAPIQAPRPRAAAESRSDRPRDPQPTDKASLTEPESRMRRTAGGRGSLQGYNAHVAADAGPSGLIVGQHLSDETAACRLAGAGVASVVPEAGPPAVLLADKGCEHSALIEQVEAAHQVLILCPLRHRPHPQENPRQRRGQRRHVFERRQRMKARPAEPAWQELYRRRAATVEPVFARIKRHMGFRRRHCWGQRAASAEWTLVCRAHNLRMLTGKLPRR
jgi:hypothetical protein